MKVKLTRVLRGLTLCALGALLSAALLSSCAGSSEPRSDTTSGYLAGSTTIPATEPTADQAAGSDTTLDPSVLSFRMMGCVDPDQLTIEKHTEWSEVIVAGEVVRIDTPRWNSPDGKQWRPTSATEQAVVYTTFYVKPTAILKGEPKWGRDLVAFRLTGVFRNLVSAQQLGTPPTTGGFSRPCLSVGEVVVAFGRLAPGRYGGVYDPAEAYWLTNGEDSLWAGADESNLVNQGVTKHPEERALSLDALALKVADYLDKQRWAPGL